MATIILLMSIFFAIWIGITIVGKIIYGHSLNASTLATFALCITSILAHFLGLY